MLPTAQVAAEQQPQQQHQKPRSLVAEARAWLLSLRPATRLVVVLCTAFFGADMLLVDPPTRWCLVRARLLGWPLQGQRHGVAVPASASAHD